MVIDSTKLPHPAWWSVVSMRRVCSILLLCMVPSMTFADQSTAFNDGRAIGSSVNQPNVNAINAGNIQNKIPAYGQTVTESSYFQGGRGDTIGPGVSKVTACSTTTPSSDPVQRQECDAINFLARNPDIRPQFTITGNDPMILNARTARTTSESTFQSLGVAGGTGSNTQCQTRSETTPAQFTTETCSSLREIGTEQCSMGRIINIDTDANYQCDRTATVLSTATRAPSVTTPSCTMGRIIDINSDANFQCDETVAAYETLTCQRSAQVGTSLQVSCSPGQTVVAEQYSSTLAGDPCWGGDKLVFSYTCQATDTPQIDIHILRDVYGAFPWNDPATYHASGLSPNFSFSATFSNCKADVVGTTSCINGRCTGSYSAAIYYPSGMTYEPPQQQCIGTLLFEGYCDGYWQYYCASGTLTTDFDGNYLCGTSTWSYSGTLTTSAQFSTYNPVAIFSGWDNGCAALEQRAQ